MEGNRSIFTFIIGMGLGAGLMYSLDPNRGRRRRALALDKLIAAQHELQFAADKAVRDLTNRVRGVVFEARAALRRDECPDEVLEKRVRAHIGRFVSHLGSIEVRVHDGVVTLRGPVLQAEADDLATAVASVRGVKGVEDYLELHKQTEYVPELQGAARSRVGRLKPVKANWAPATRLLVSSAGVLMIAGGLNRSGLSGWPTALLGSALLLRAGTNLEADRLVGMGGRRSIDVQKTIHINAPLKEVFRLWSNPENFPRFMAHVREVRGNANDCYRWVISGPGGAPVSWSAHLTEIIPDKLVAWASESGSLVGNAGIVRFDRENGGTRIHIRMSYSPPGGAIGHAAAVLFGSDPKRVLDEDLARFKSLLEIGKTHAHGRQVKKHELAG